MNIEPKISFIIVNFNGLLHLKQCFDTIQKLNYPKDKLEIIMVDNGSTDNSVGFVNKKYSNVKVIRNLTNEGFAKPNNDAAKMATGDFIALINNDMKIDSEWLNDMIATLNNQKDESYICVGSKILNWDGSKLDFAGGSLSFYGHGYQFDFGIDAKMAQKKYNVDRDILFACGGAMIIDRATFLKVGGFDEDYFAYYEDADLGWRLWVLGYKVAFCAKSICYHKHNGTSKKMDRIKVNTMYDRNSLFTIYKNYGEDKVYNMTLASMLLKVFKGNKSNYGNDKDAQSSETLAISQFLKSLPKMKLKRDYIQNNRKCSDKIILDTFFSEPYKKLLLGCFDYSYNQTIANLSSSLELEKYFGKPGYDLLIVCSDVVGIKMAGPAIRYFEFAKQMSQFMNVTLAIPNTTDLDLSKYKFKVIEYSLSEPNNLVESFSRTDIVIIQGMILKNVETLQPMCDEKIVIVDLYDPFTIENLEVHKSKALKVREEIHSSDLNTLVDQLRIGDYFICASEKQKDLWIGMLSAVNKINPREYDLSSKLEKLIGLVPFGINDIDPVHSRDVLKTKIPDLKDDDKVLIWGGGVWNWFDPLTLIKAVGNLSKVRNDIKLFFLGVKHPNPSIPEMEMLGNAIKLAEELNIRDKYVFFNMDWVDYDDRQNYLLESFAGVSCHFDNLETRFSFRTRILDYLWAKLPIISTQGDYFADEIEKNKLGIIVKFKDVDDLTKAITKICDDKVFYDECVDNIIEYREKFKWSIVTKPLKEFCANPMKKKTSKFDETYNYISDINQINKDEILGPLYDSDIVGQIFKCRYPYLTSIDIMIGTYMRSNDHVLKFKLYEYGTDNVLFSKDADVSLLADNAWMTFSFNPILNSEGRKFHFTVEPSGAAVNNSICVFKTNKISKYGNIFLNGIEIDGNLTFRTQCILSDKPLDESEGTTLLDVLDSKREVLKTDFSSRVQVEDLVKKLVENEINSSKTSEEELSKLKSSITKLAVKTDEINTWKNAMNSRFRILKGFSFIKKLFK